MYLKPNATKLCGIRLINPLGSCPSSYRLFGTAEQVHCRYIRVCTCVHMSAPAAIRSYLLTCTPCIRCYLHGRSSTPFSTPHARSWHSTHPSIHPSTHQRQTSPGPLGERKWTVTDRNNIMDGFSRLIGVCGGFPGSWLHGAAMFLELWWYKHSTVLTDRVCRANYHSSCWA